jgi:hypothetical protein
VALLESAVLAAHAGAPDASFEADDGGFKRPSIRRTVGLIFAAADKIGTISQLK